MRGLGRPVRRLMRLVRGLGHRQTDRQTDRQTERERERERRRDA